MRKGRFVQTTSRLDAAALKTMQDSWPQERNNLRKKIEEKLKLLTTLIQDFDPLKCLFVLFAKNCLVDIETYSEPENEGSEARVEYAHSIVTAVSTLGSKEPGEEQFDLFENYVEEILKACQFFFMIKEHSPDDPFSTEETKFIGMMRHMFIRGSSHIEHDTELVLKFFEPHDAFFRRNACFTAAELIDFCNQVESQLEATINRQLKLFSKIRELHKKFITALQSDPRLTKEIAMKNLRETEEGKSLFIDLAAAQKEGANSAHVVPVNEKTRVFCQRLSLSPGQNSGFLTFAKSPGWPTNDTKIHTKPLIEHNGKYYCPNPVLLLRNRFAILEETIRELDPNYFADQYPKVRGKTVEELAIAHISKLLPKGQIFRNLYYSIVENGQEKRCETDGIVLFDDRLFILEMKSAPFSKAAMRGADKRLKEDLTDLMDDPYQQALRTLRFIKGSSSAQFEFEDGSPAVLVDHTKFRRTYLINVTLSDIGHISARLNSAREMGLVQGKEWPWSVFINDLRVISEIIETPSEFLLYLERRLALNELSAVWSIDELDYLGMFLKEGLYFEEEELSGIHRFTPIGYTVDIERYYNYVAGRVSSGDKPRLKISDWYRQLVQKIEATDKAGAYHVGSLLLSLAGTRQDEIAAWFSEYSVRAEKESKAHSLTLISKELAVFVFYVAPKLTPEEFSKHEQYADVKRLQTGIPSLILIGLEGAELRTVDFKIIEGPVKDTPELKRKLLNFRQTRYRAFVQQNGKPGRNDPCPCNSGRKFKKCCLDESSSW